MRWGLETTAHRDHARLEVEGVLSCSPSMYGRSSKLSKLQSKVSVRRVREALTERRGTRQHLVGSALENGPAETMQDLDKAEDDAIACSAVAGARENSRGCCIISAWMFDPRSRSSSGSGCTWTWTDTLQRREAR